jgi:hypothetical protein
MVRGPLLAVSVLTLFAVFAGAAAPTIDIATAAADWSPRFILTGTKTEPTYIEHIRLERDGNLFVLQGGAPAGMAPSRESVVIDAEGNLRHLDCPPGMPCDSGEPPSGFLASAVIVAAVRQARLSGRFPILAYGGHELLCLPAEQLGVQQPVLDPCVEIHSGAVIAQRHRRSGEFDGPSLDPWSIELSTALHNTPLQFN